MLPSANQKGSGVCAGTSKWIPSGTSAAKAVIIFAAFIAALKRCATQKQSATRRFTANLHPEALPKIASQNSYPRIFTPSRHRESDPAAISAISWCLRAIYARPSSTRRISLFRTVPYLRSCSQSSDRISGNAIVLGVGSANSYIDVLRSAASAGSLPFLAIDPALSSTK
jgi:hypothetical protein